MFLQDHASNFLCSKMLEIQTETHLESVESLRALEKMESFLEKFLQNFAS